MSTDSSVGHYQKNKERIKKKPCKRCQNLPEEEKMSY